MQRLIRQLALEFVYVSLIEDLPAFLSDRNAEALQVLQGVKLCLPGEPETGPRVKAVQRSPRDLLHVAQPNAMRRLQFLVEDIGGSPGGTIFSLATISSMRSMAAVWLSAASLAPLCPCNFSHWK